MPLNARDIALRSAEEAFYSVIRSAGQDRPPYLDRIDYHRNHDNGSLAFEARFHSYVGQSVHWMLFERLDYSRFDLGGYVRECHSLYSRLYEDHMLQLELQPRREALERLYRIMAPAHMIENAREDYRRFEEHLRRHHSYVRPGSVWNDPNPYYINRTIREIEPFRHEGPSQVFRDVEETLRRSRNAVEAQMFMGSATTSTTATEQRTLTADSVLRAYERFASTPSSWNNLVASDLTEASLQRLRDYVLGDYAPQNTEADKKGIELLKSWLTPDQLAQYEKSKAFEVTGSHTGKRYRIKHGRQMNIEELDKNGKRVQGLCALPIGTLVAGDCVLAQKLAIETNEKQFLEVANKFA